MNDYLVFPPSAKAVESEKIIWVGPNQYFIYAWGDIWGHDTVVDLTVTRSGSIIYTSSATVNEDGPRSGAFPDARWVAYFDLEQPDPPIDLQPGDVITLTGGGVTRSMTIPPLLVTGVNVDTGTVSGTADPGSMVHVHVDQIQDPGQDVMADQDGYWTAIFGPDVISFNSRGGASEIDADGNYIIQAWPTPNPPNPPNPSITVHPDEDRIDGGEWTLGSILTIQIDDPNLPDYTTATTVNPADQDHNNQTWFNLNLANVFDLQPGQIVTVFDANTTKQTAIAPRSVTAVDPVADTITGITHLGIEYVIVWVCDNSGCVARYKDITPDGSWSVNFALPGEQDWENVIFDIQPDTNGGIYQRDFDGDGTVYQQWFLNRPPVITAISAPIVPVQLGQSITAIVEFSDPDINDIYTIRWDWGDGITTTGSVSAPSAAADHVYASSGVYTIKVTITDAAGESASITSQEYIVIYDPNGGFVTGGGWINSPLGAYTPDPSLIGKATFGFVSKYQKGATVPTGNTEFQFHIANMTFKSTSYDWLVIAGTKAQYKGTGTINGAGEYKFMLTAIDGSPDKFRIKIWDKATGDVIYDNQVGAEDTAEPTTVIQGGSIVIHKPK